MTVFAFRKQVVYGVSQRQLVRKPAFSTRIASHQKGNEEQKQDEREDTYIDDE